LRSLRATTYGIRAGDAQSGSLTVVNDSNLPFKTWTVKGGIILGTGGDNSNSGTGTFYEGAILSGRPTDAADGNVLKNVQAAGYGK
jgi:non-reducing end alpha-L-arabinofuranosidase